MPDSELKVHPRGPLQRPDQPESFATGSLLSRFLSGLLADLRQGLRSLFWNPTFSLIVIFTLALGIGSVTAIFSLVDGVLLAPLPYGNPQEIVTLATREGNPALVSGPEYLSYRARNDEFNDLAIYLAWTEGLNLTGYGEPYHPTTNPISANLFSVLGVEPLLGRTFDSSEDQPGGARVMILNHGFWERHFGGDPGIVGQTVRMSDLEYQVVGVMPPEFGFPMEDVDIWVPLASDLADPATVTDRRYFSVGRLRTGSGVEGASRAIDRITSQLAADDRQSYPETSSGSRAVSVRRLHEVETDSIRSTLFLLWGAGFLVLLIAVVNVCTLLLLRGANRQKGLAIRTALGAVRLQVMKQLVVEYLLLFLAAGLAGLVVALLFLEFGMAQMQGGLPLGTPTISWTLVGFSFLISLLFGVLFGSIPALQSSAVDLAGALRSAGRRSTGDKSPGLRNGLVVGQVALSLVLLIGAGLFLRTFLNVLNIEWGVATDRVQVFRIWPPESRYAGASELRVFYSVLLERVRSLPGVRAAGAAAFAHLTAVQGRRVMPEGFPANVPEYALPFGLINSRYRQVTPGYLEALQVGLVQGRYFDDRDIDGSSPVLIVDQEFARTAWPDSVAVGRRVAVPDLQNGQHRWATVVGVVEHTREDLRGSRAPQTYYPAYQTGRRVMHVIVRSSIPSGEVLPQIRSELAQVDAQLPIYQVMTLSERLDSRLSQQRFVSFLVGMFSAMALLVTAVGLYGVVAFHVNQRTHEFGIRLSLGAPRKRILGLVLGKGGVLIGAGILLGLGGALVSAFALTRIWSEFLFGVQSLDLPTYSLACLVLVLVSLLACLAPAYRATQVDPLKTLRSE